jgi:hypothetical protein
MPASSTLSNIHSYKCEQENQNCASNRQHIRHFVRDGFNHVFWVLSGVIVGGWCVVRHGNTFA